MPMLPVLVVLLLTVCGFAQERLFVVQSLDESLGQVELASGTVDGHVLTLGYGCNDIAWRGNRLFVTNSLLNTVQVIDAETGTTLRDMPTEGGTNPYSVIGLNPDTIAVSCWVSGNVLLMRPSDGTVIGNLAVGTAPEGMVVAGERLFVCLTRFLAPGSFGPGVVMVLNRHTLALEDSIPVGMNPQFAAVDDRGRLHVVCTGDYGDAGGEVDVVSLSNLERVGVVATGGSPGTVSFGGGYAFVAAGGWGETGAVYRYRLDDLSLLNGAQNPLATGPGASDVEGQADGTFYVSCFAADIVEHRSADGALLDSYPMGDGPGQMVVYPGPSSVEPRDGLTHPDFRVTEAYPNPFNGDVRLVFSVPTRASGRILIYNALGQLADVLPVGAGETGVVWGPRRSGLTSVSSGSYWAIWEAGGGSPVKLMYLK